MDYGARFYDPVTGRWQVNDPLATKYYNFSVYNYCLNNPLKFVDPSGRSVIKYYDDDGNYIGTDGSNDGQRVVIRDKKEQKAVNKTNKSNGVTPLSATNSGYMLPGDVTLKESLNTLDRTVNNGGKSEESSIVTDKSGVIQGEKGPEYVDGMSVLEGTLPAIPAGETVEATIHSHMTYTSVNKDGSTTYSSANELGPNDPSVFKEYGAKENIVVGRIEPPNPTTKAMDGTYSAGAVAPLGVIFYGKNTNNNKPELTLTKKALLKILSK